MAYLFNVLFDSKNNLIKLFGIIFYNRINYPYNRFNINMRHINDCIYDYHDICVNGSFRGLIYPLRLRDKYFDIRCKYSKEGNCENKSIKIKYDIIKKIEF